MIYLLNEFFLILYQLYKKNNKVIGFIGLLIFGLLCGTASYQINDFIVYETSYNQVGTLGMPASYFEKGYSRLGYACFKLGMNYEQFRLFFSVLIIIILYIAASRFTNNVCLFASIFGCTLFFTDTVQIRSFMAISLVLLALSFLKKYSKKNILISIAVIFIAAQFQSLSYLFLGIVLLRIIFNKHNINLKQCFVMSSLLYGSFIILGRGTITKLIGEIAALTGGRVNLQEKVTTQYTTGGSNRTLIMVAIVTWLVVIVASQIIKYCDIDLKQNGNIAILYTGIVSTVFILPFTYLAIDYARYPRGCILFFILIICITRQKIIKLNKDEKLLLLIIILITIVMCGLYYNLMWGHNFINSIFYIIK